MTTPAHGAALADPRVPIVLADGTEAHFVVTMLTLTRVEEEFGSVEAMRSELSEIDMSKPVFRRLATIFALLMVPEVTTDEALISLDLRRLNDYTDALSQAFDVAFPDDDPEEAAITADPTKARAPKKGSPGRTGSTSPRSRSAARTKGSGG